MKIVHISNALNHHSLPLALSFSRQKEVDYVYIETAPMNQRRAKMGWALKEDYGFVFKAYENKEKEALKLVNEADVVIIGKAPLRYIDERLKKDKLTFRACERLFKDGTSSRMFIKNICRVIKHRLINYQNKRLFYLCMSGYLAHDVNMFSNYKDKCLKWAYFVENRNLSFSSLKRNKTTTILWAGRLLPWKHPDAAVRVAISLKNENYPFQMNIIGDGELKETLASTIQKNNLSDCVKLLGAMHPDKVRDHMEESDIFLFTSDFKEGWGVVLGEAMSSGCAVISSHACGSAPFLINQGHNGFMYLSGSEKELLDATKKLLDNLELRKKIAYTAFRDMRTLWDADSATQRLIQVVDAINNKKDYLMFGNGPLSQAPILNDDFYRKRYMI